MGQVEQGARNGQNKEQMEQGSGGTRIRWNKDQGSIL